MVDARAVLVALTLLLGTGLAGGTQPAQALRFAPPAALVWQTPKDSMTDWATRRRARTYPRNPILPVEPGDIVGQKIAPYRIEIRDAEYIEPGDSVHVLIKENGAVNYLSESLTRIYFENGAIIPHWLTADASRRYMVREDGRAVKGGSTAASESTYTVIRNFDGIRGLYVGPPSVDTLGEYVVTIRHDGDDTGLDVGENTPHHGGKFYQAPKGWRILKAVFGVGSRRDDLLLTLRNQGGNPALYWLVNSIPHIFPQWVQDACGKDRHHLNDCKMRYIRNEDGKQRDPAQQVRLVPVPGGAGVSDAVVVWNAYPR